VLEINIIQFVFVRISYLVPKMRKVLSVIVAVKAVQKCCYIVDMFVVMVYERAEINNLELREKLISTFVNASS
jgi:hypothetical protein